MRATLTAPLILLLLAAPAAAQDSQAQQLKNDPGVQRSQDPQPSPQGTKSPDAGYTDTKNEELTRLLTEIWARPVDLQGRPIQVSGEISSPPPAPADPPAPVPAPPGAPTPAATAN